MDGTIRLGTRGSPLALRQAEILSEKLKNVEKNLEIECVIIKTSGDIDQTSTLDKIGGKGVFIKEIEEALLSRKIDIAVHSFKDITSEMPMELELVLFLPPESIADVLLAHDHLLLKNLPLGSRIGTGSLRRQMFLYASRPDLAFVPIRGNVETRLRKLKNGEVDALLLSEAGVIRLGLTEHVSQVLNPETFLPAPGQGVIAVQARRDLSGWMREIVLRVMDNTQFQISVAEYRFMKTIGFNCRIPLGLRTWVNGNKMYMKVAKAESVGLSIQYAQDDDNILNGLQLATRLAEKMRT